MNFKMTEELETTYDLLQATVPSIQSPKSKPGPPESNADTLSTPKQLKVPSTPSPYCCSSEDEVYFGPKTDKELNGRNAR